MFLERNILIQWLIWHFFETPKEILKGLKNFLLFNLNYFSIPLLLKSFFSYWRRYRWSYGRGFDIGRYLETAFSNLFSRSIGAVMRSFLICIGLIVEIFIFFTGVIIFLAWLFLPLLLISGLSFGLYLLFF